MKHYLERSLWFGAFATLCFTVVSNRAHSTTPYDPHHSRSQPDRGVTMFDEDTLTAAAERTVQSDPFRADRHPASVPFSMTPAGSSAPLIPAGPPLRIALRGTIGGPPWRAILSGIPGHDGTVLLSPGDSLGGILVRRVTRDSAVVRLKDSTWAVAIASGGA